MTDVSSLPVTGEAGPDLTPEELGLFGYAVTQMELDLDAMAKAPDIAAWFEQLDTLKSVAGSEGGAAVQALSTAVLDTLGEAVRDGELDRADASQALSWVVQTHGIKALTHAFIAAGGLVAAFALYDLQHGHKAAAAHRPPAKGKGTGVQIHKGAGHPASSSGGQLVSPLGGAGPVVTTGQTAGDRLVEAAEARIVPRRLEVPGMAEETAKAIQWATGVAYYDATDVLAEVTTDILARVDTVERLANEALHRSPGTAKVAPHPAWALESALGNLTRRVVHLQDVIVNQGRELQRLRDRQPATTSKPAPTHKAPTPTDLADIRRQIGDLEHHQAAHTKVIGTLVRQITPILPVAGVTPALTQLGSSFFKKLPPTLTQEDLCCEDNLAQTKPIKKYGGADKLVHDLRGALVKLAELGIVLSAVGTVATILDAPSALLGTYRAATWVAPLADRAARVALADVSWADTVHQGA